MNRNLYLVLLLALPTLAQVTAQNTTITPSGMLPPKLGYDAIVALPSPLNGTMVYDTTFDCLRVYSKGKWLCSYQDPLNFIPNMVDIASAGGPVDDFGEDIAVDSAGNVYVTGYFQGTINFGNTSITSSGSADIFVAKYNSNGVVQWVQSAGGGAIDVGYAIAVDKNGNVYVTGYYTGTAAFGAFSAASQGSVDTFVAKYNSSGTIQWVQSAGGINNDIGLGVTVDNGGNVYVTGVFEGTSTFGSTSKTSQGSFDSFVAKYNSSGTLQWVQSAGGTSIDFSYAIAVDGSGNVYVTGYFNGNATFGTFSKTSAGAGDIFLAKYNNNGIVQWVQSAGGPGNDVGQGITVDGSGNVYITGYHNGLQMGPETVYAYGSVDMLVAKYNSSGTVQWAKSAGGLIYDYGEDIAVDPQGNVYVTGSFQGTGKFYNDNFIVPSGFTLTSAGDSDIFVAKYNSEGRSQWGKSAGGTGPDRGLGIGIDSYGGLYVSGTYFGTATFGRNSKTSAGGLDVFIIKIDK